MLKSLVSLGSALYVCSLKLNQPEFDISNSSYQEECGDRNNYKCWKKGGHSLDHKPTKGPEACACQKTGKGWFCNHREGPILNTNAQCEECPDVFKGCLDGGLPELGSVDCIKRCVFSAAKIINVDWIETSSKNLYGDVGQVRITFNKPVDIRGHPSLVPTATVQEKGDAEPKDVTSGMTGGVWNYGRLIEPMRLLETQPKESVTTVEFKGGFWRTWGVSTFTYTIELPGAFGGMWKGRKDRCNRQDKGPQGNLQGTCPPGAIYNAGSNTKADLSFSDTSQINKCFHYAKACESTSTSTWCTKAEDNHQCQYLGKLCHFENDYISEALKHTCPLTCGVCAKAVTTKAPTTTT